MKNYGNYNFKKYTLYQFNTYFKDGKIKNNLMSFYSWLIRISKNNSIDISKNLLTKLWNRKQSKKASKTKTTYKKVNSSTVLRWLHKLEKAKLLFIDRKISKNKYLLNQDGSIHPNIFSSAKKCTSKCTCGKDTQSVITSSLSDITSVSKKEKLSSIKDMDILSIYNYKNKYCKNTEYISSQSEMLKIIEQMFRVMRVRSNVIRGRVLNVLNYWNTITKKKAYKYVERAITNAREQYYREHKNAYFNKNHTLRDTFDNYPQRDPDIILAQLHSKGY